MRKCLYLAVVRLVDNEWTRQALKDWILFDDMNGIESILLEVTGMVIG